MMVETIVQTVNYTLTEISRLSAIGYHHVPFAHAVVRYIQHSYQDDPIRIALELLLVIFAFKYLTSKRYKPDTNDVQLTPEEIDELVAEWKPEPLVPPTSIELQAELDALPVIQGPSGPHVKLADGKDYLNLMSHDFLGLSTLDKIHQAAIQASRKYGVGACGPPGFYGTIDVHLELERELARFYGTEEAIIYSQAFATISSVIPAFAKRGDILVCFYENTYDIAPLPRLLELKKEYKYRLIMDDSLGFGVLGKRGAGLADHFGVNVRDIDVITASMANALASAGGFCVGSKEVVDHQRLSGAGYCFSAALPALLAVAALEGLRELETNPSLLSSLRTNSLAFQKSFGESKFAELVGMDAGPCFHVRFKRTFAQRKEEEQALQKVVELVAKERIAVARAKYIVDQEMFPPKPSVRIILSASHQMKELERAGRILRKAMDTLSST